jgi:thymidylate synthase
MQTYLNLLQDILDNGTLRENERTGVGTKSVFGRTLRFDLSEGFPLLTTKKMFFRGVIEELLWFLRGDTDSTLLEEKKVNIWKFNTSREFLDQRGLNDYPIGEIGVGYGWQWRNWGGTYLPFDVYGGYKFIEKKRDGVDQIANLIETIKNDPQSRRMLVSAWNVGEIDRMCLPPCHYTFQCYVDDGKLSLMWNQRSVDFGLGWGFNVASYAALVHILAKVTDLEPGELVFCGGDVHVYLNHEGALREQLDRKPYPLPTLKIDKELKTLEDVEALTFQDFKLVGYQHHPPIKMSMAV